MKNVWFNHLLENPKFWPKGFTKKRLEKIKNQVLSDKDIMWDLLKRHGAQNLTPDKMKEQHNETYLHCMGNFAGNVAELLRKS